MFYWSLECPKYAQRTTEEELYSARRCLNHAPAVYLYAKQHQRRHQLRDGVFSFSAADARDLIMQNLDSLCPEKNIVQTFLKNLNC